MCDSPVFIVFDKLDKIGRKTLNSVIALAIKAGRLDLVRYFVVPGVLLYNAVPKKAKKNIIEQTFLFWTSIKRNDIN